jgi:cholesterol transport system auxiliary component
MLTRRDIVGAGFTAILAGGFSGCASIKPPPDTYDISAPREFPGLRAGSRAQLLVVDPTALKALDSQSIVVKPSANAIEYLASSQWPDRLPKLVQARLVEAFENTGRVRAVAKPGDGLVIDYQIVSDIRAFEANIASSEAVIELSVKIVSDRTGRVVGTRILAHAVPLGGSSPAVVVDALNVAFDELARELVAWVLSKT